MGFGSPASKHTATDSVSTQFIFFSILSL